MKVRRCALPIVGLLLAAAGVYHFVAKPRPPAVRAVGRPPSAETSATAASAAAAGAAMVTNGAGPTARGGASDGGADDWTSGAPLPEEQGVLGKWIRRTDGTLARCVGEQIRAGFPSATRLELGPDRSDVLLITRTEDLGENQGSIIGSLEGWPDSTVVLGYADGAVSGTVNLPDEQRSFVINQTEDGTLQVTELDLTHAPQCGEPPPAGGLPPAPPSAVPNS